MPITLTSTPVLQSDTFEIQRQKINRCVNDIASINSASSILLSATLMNQTLMSQAIVTYGEGGSMVGDIARNWVKVVEHPLLVSGTKYAYIVFTYGQEFAKSSSYRRPLDTGVAGETGNVYSAGYNYGAARWAVPTATRLTFGDLASPFHPALNDITYGGGMITYQSTFIYDPSSMSSYSAYMPGIGEDVWGLWPYVKGASNYGTIKFKKLLGQYAGTDDGKGYYVLFIFDYNVLKGAMDRLKAIKDVPTHRFNDPLGGLNNVSSWTVVV